MSSIKYYVCCPMCDKDKCVRGTEECDAVKWEKEKIVGEKWRKENFINAFNDEVLGGE